MQRIYTEKLDFTNIYCLNISALNISNIKILIAARGVCTLLRINGDSWDVAVVNIDCYF